MVCTVERLVGTITKATHTTLSAGRVVELVEAAAPLLNDPTSVARPDRRAMSRGGKQVDTARVPSAVDLAFVLASVLVLPASFLVAAKAARGRRLTSALVLAIPPALLALAALAPACTREDSVVVNGAGKRLSAEAIDADLARAPRDRLATLIGGPDAWLVQRWAHREEHLAQIDAALDGVGDR